MVPYRTIGLLIGAFLITAAILVAVIYVVATRQQSDRISSLDTSSPFLVQFASSQEYLARPLTVHKKLSTTPNSQDALRFFASRNSNGAVLLVSFVANNAGNFLTQRQSSGATTNEVWYLDVDGQDSGSRVECNSYDLDTGQGQQWTQENSWQLTSDNFLRSLRGQGDLFLSSSPDGVEATKKQLANEVQLVLPEDTPLQKGAFFSAMPYRIRISSSYVVETNDGDLALGKKQDALVFKSFRTNSGTLVCRCYPDSNFLVLNPQQDEQVQYLAATVNKPSLKSLENRNIRTVSLWKQDGSTLVSNGRYLAMSSESIALTSTKSNAATVTIEPIEEPLPTQ